MKDLLDLYARYDGPPPRRRNKRTNPRYYEEMLRALLYTIRIRRGRGERETLAPLTLRVRGVRKILERTIKEQKFANKNNGI